MSFRGKKVIFSSAATSMLFYYRYRYKADYEIFGLGELFARYPIDWKSLRYLSRVINHYIKEGYYVFFLATWPEIDDYRPHGYEFGYGWIYKKIKETSDYEVLLVGPYVYRVSWKRYAPIYELVIIQDVFLFSRNINR